MHAILRHVAACAALSVALAATGTALAAPPESPPGLETAPGQEKTAEPAATAAPAPAPASGKASAPGQVKKTSTAASSTKSTGINSTSSGVKPSSTTEKNWSTTAGANPDMSKRYGNGTTAAQIATSRGAAASTEIYGPGNSQPHKVCKKVNNGGKEVWTDHHAVKSYPTACGASPSVQAPAVTRGLGLGPTTVTAAAVAPAGAAAAAAAVAPAAGAPAAVGVAGVAATGPEAGGVAGAFSEIGGVAGAALPFTGFPLWAAIVLAISAIVVGVGLRRKDAN